MSVHASRRCTDLEFAPGREALRKLEAEAFITSELHRGAVVVRSEDARLFENFLIRANLDSLAAGLAAQIITPEDLDEITKMIFEELKELASDQQHYALCASLRVGSEYGFTWGACAAPGAVPA